MNHKESNRLRDKIMEILQEHCTDNTGTDVRALYPILHWAESELHEYGKHLQGKVLDLEQSYQLLTIERDIILSKNEELKDDFLSEQEENTSLRSYIEELENTLGLRNSSNPDWTTDEVNERMKEKDNEIDALKQTIEFDAACKTDLECRITDLENLLKMCLEKRSKKI